jgi:5-methylcytosine-specific restriction endonuclease McrA
MARKRTRNSRSQELARKRIIKARGKKCELCGYEGYVELHHIVEAVNGGTFTDDNLILLCEKCHAEAHGWKKDKYIDKARQCWRRDG